MQIPAIPEHVCLEHGLEFWTGLLGYVSGHSDCVKYKRLCTCRSCEESSARARRAIAIVAAGPSPRDRKRFTIRLAS